MPYLVRKINRAKWDLPDLATNDDVGADAITVCMKTSGSTLSVWRIESEADLDQAVLAFVSTNERFDTLHFVMLDEERLLNNQITIAEVPGNSPIDELNETHRNLSNLTYSGLGVMKNCIVDILRGEQEVRYSKARLKELVNSALGEGKLSLDSLNPRLQDDLL